MASCPPTFVFGDRPTRPLKPVRTLEHIIRHVFTAQGFVAIGIVFQAACTLSIPRPYGFLPGALVIAISSWPTLSRLIKKTEDTPYIAGRTTAYLDFAHPSHAGKQPGAVALPVPVPHQQNSPKLAVMLIGSQCHSTLGALQPEFKSMGDVFAAMMHELRTAPPEHDTGFLNAEYYMSSAQHTNNSNMVVIYFKSFAHILKLAHAQTGTHWTAWKEFRKLQNDNVKLGNQIGLWHEVFEVSRAEAIYINMPRLGLGDMWDAVRAQNGQYVYRNSLVSARGHYTTSEGRMGSAQETQCPVGEKK